MCVSVCMYVCVCDRVYHAFACFCVCMCVYLHIAAINTAHRVRVCGVWCAYVSVRFCECVCVCFVIWLLLGLHRLLV